MVELVRQYSVTVGTTVVEVSPEPGNSKRRVLYVKNVSSGTQVISLGLGQDAVINNGWTLNKTDFMVDSQTEGYMPFNGRISAVSDGAGATLTVFERMG